MPSYYDNPQVFANAVIEDVDKFNRAPFYLVKNEVQLFQQWNVYDQLFGDIPWQPNMGDTMKGVRPEPSPVGRATFYPNLISTDPNKDVFETLESTEQMQLRWHDYSSKIFAFLPSWQDFRDNQLDFNHKDIVRQVQNGNNIFIRTMIVDMSPNVIACGGGANGATDLITGCPTAIGNKTQTGAGSKTSAWFAAAVIPNIKSNLSYRAVKNAATILTEDLDAPFFEGSKNMPKPNEALKGKYVLIGSNEAWLQFDDDADILAKRDQLMNLVDNDYQGILANGRVIYKADRFPVRFNDDGVFIAPQIVEMPSKKTRPNPAWVSAKYEQAILMGAEAYRTVKVGTPPRDFAGMSKDKFYKMRWNGEIRLTDQFVITRGSIAGGDLDISLNDDGRFLKLKGTTTHGILPGEVYNCVPIYYRRQRKATV
jgi:hypothetical protein